MNAEFIEILHKKYDYKEQKIMSRKNKIVGGGG